MKDVIVSNEMDFINAFNTLSSLWRDKKWLRINVSTKRTRSGPQNNALHLFFRNLAEDLNNAGYPSQIGFAGRPNTIEVDWTEQSVKELWKAIQNAMFPDTAGRTSHLERGQINMVYDVLYAHLTKITDGTVRTAFPSCEGPMLGKVYAEKRGG